MTLETSHRPSIATPSLMCTSQIMGSHISVVSAQLTASTDSALKAKQKLTASRRSEQHASQGRSPEVPQQFPLTRYKRSTLLHMIEVGPHSKLYCVVSYLLHPSQQAARCHKRQGYLCLLCCVAQVSPLTSSCDPNLGGSFWHPREVSLSTTQKGCLCVCVCRNQGPCQKDVGFLLDPSQGLLGLVPP